MFSKLPRSHTFNHPLTHSIQPYHHINSLNQIHQPHPTLNKCTPRGPLQTKDEQVNVYSSNRSGEVKQLNPVLNRYASSQELKWCQSSLNSSTPRIHCKHEFNSEGDTRRSFNGCQGGVPRIRCSFPIRYETTCAMAMLAQGLLVPEL